MDLLDLEGQEATIIYFLRQGYNVKQVSIKSKIPLGTVKKRLRCLYRDFKVSGAVGLMCKFYESKLDKLERELEDAKSKNNKYANPKANLHKAVS